MGIRRNTLFIIAGFLLLMFGLVAGYGPLVRARSDLFGVASSKVSYPEIRYAKQSEKYISGVPVRIEIPSVGIDLSIIEGKYYPASNTWTLSKDKAHFATVSALSNNKSGNTFVYGHNRSEVFAKLPKVNIGDIAIITTDNGHRFVYKYYELIVTKPDDMSSFKYSGPPILTLQTCTGVWYQNRSLLTFSLESVD